MDEKLIIKSIEIAKENRENFCVALLQQKLKIGSIACAKLIEILENKGVISTYNPNEKIRRVLI